MRTQHVPLEQVTWSDAPGVEQITVSRTHHSGVPVEIPVAAITGAAAGSTFVVT